MPKQDLVSLTSELGQGYSLRQIKHLHDISNPTPVDLRSIRLTDEGLRLYANERINEDSITAEDLITIETRALARLFIPEVWLKVRDIIDRYPPGLVELGADNEPKPKKEEMLQFASECKNANQILAALYHLTAPMLKYCINQWAKEREETMDKDSDNALEQRMRLAFGRYGILIAAGKSYMGSPSTRQAVTDYREHLFSGIETANRVLWRTFGLLHEVYKEQYGEGINEAKIKVLAEGSIPLISGLATSDISVFRAIQGQIEIPSLFLGTWPRYDSKKFWISEQDGRLNLEILPEIFEKVEVMVKKMSSKIKTGCPAALHDKGEINVVLDMCKWYLNLASEFYFPRFRA